MVDTGIVRVRTSLDRARDESGTYPERTPKSRASRRDVPLPPEKVVRLRRHRLATGRPMDGALVFANPEGQPLSPVPAYRAFNRACRAVVVAEAAEALERAQAADDAPRAVQQAEEALDAARKAPYPASTTRGTPSPRMRSLRDSRRTPSPGYSDTPTPGSSGDGTGMRSPTK